MNFMAAKCPVCGADIQVDGEKTNCFCMYCGSQIQVQSAINSVSVDGIASTNARLTRGFQFLQTFDFEKANEYFSKALDLEPTNGNAFLGQLLSVIKCPDCSSAKVYVEDFSQYKFAYQYGDESVRAELATLAKKSKERFEEKMNFAAAKVNSISLECDVIYSFLWSNDEKPRIDDFEWLKNEMKRSQRFDNVEHPAVAFYDSECSTLHETLPALEAAVGEKNKMILFVRNCDDDLLKILHDNCLRGIFKCAVVCIDDVNRLREAALLCGTTCNSATVPDSERMNYTYKIILSHLKNAYIYRNKIILEK